MEVSWTNMANGSNSVADLKCGDYDLSSVGHLQEDNGVVQTINCVLNTPSAVIAVLGNFVVILSIWRTPSMHTPGNVLLCSLAMSDLSVGLLSQPLFISYNVAQLYVLPETFCETALALAIVGSTTGTVSLLTITAISIDRLIALRLHLSYDGTVTVKRVMIVLVSIWITCITGSISLVWPQTTLIFNLFYPLVVILTLSCTLFAYCRIFQIVRYHQVQIQSQSVGQQEQDTATNVAQIRKSVLNVFLVFCILLVCYLPFLATAVVVPIQGLSKTNQSIYEVTWSLMMINSCLNPLVYCWRITAIRRAVLATLAKLRNSICH